MPGDYAAVSANMIIVFLRNLTSFSKFAASIMIAWGQVPSAETASESKRFSYLLRLLFTHEKCYIGRFQRLKELPTFVD